MSDAYNERDGFGRDMMTVAHEPLFKLRSYQQEMLDASLQKNVIVVMETGSGKTHVAIARIQAELERLEQDKFIWFMTPTVLLAEQQSSLLSKYLPAYALRTLTGNDGVQKWTEQDVWDAVLGGIQVIVSTPAVLADALEHSFIKISRLALCVFDEAHNCVKGSAMNRIMKYFYQPARDRGLSVPHILGLTASPVVNEKPGSLETIQANLDSVAITPKKHSLDLAKYVHPPKICTVEYRRASNQSTAIRSPLLHAFSEAVRTYNIFQDPYIIKLSQFDDNRSTKELERALSRQSTYCLQQLKAVFSRALTLHEQLGSSISEWYIKTCIQKYRQHSQPEDTFWSDLSSEEHAHLLTALNDIESRTAPVTISDPDEVTDKSKQLVRILKSEHTEEMRAIIFVQQRVLVVALQKMLTENSDITACYHIGTSVGTSNSANRKSTLADLMQLNDLNGDLTAFRRGDKNLMISTNVLEEGIDIPACNMVICFDLPPNLVSFIQQRGRARHIASKYLLFVAGDSSDIPSKRWAHLEEEMKQRYQDDTKDTLQSKESAADLSRRQYHVVSSGALLTLESAKSHLYHFCDISTSQSRLNIDARPEFDTRREEDTKLWSASVQLPSIVHPDLRYATCSQFWQTEDTAVKDAAFEAYVALHEAGLVNNNLLPLIKDFGPELGEQHKDQPIIVRVAERKSVVQDTYRSITPGATCWNTSVIVITFGGQQVIQIPILSKMDLTPERFSLFWNESMRYEIGVEPSQPDEGAWTPQNSVLIAQATEVILRSIHDRRMSRGRGDLPFLFLPTKPDQLSVWLEKSEGWVTLSSEMANNGKQELGLVKIPEQFGRLFVLDRILHNDAGEDALLIPFPKRRDFLHNPSNSKPSDSKRGTSRQILPLATCEVSKLSLQYALFAAFWPCILHRIETRLLASDVQKRLLRTVDVQDVSLIQEALTSPAARDDMDYNRLEFLGDSILKHCTVLQVVSEHLIWPEKYLVHEKDRIVRNKNLAQAAMNLDLAQYISTQPFTGNKWRPEYLDQSKRLSSEPAFRQMSTKVLADVVEAIIGAAFVDAGLKKARACISFLLPTETWYSASQCVDRIVNDLRPTDVTNVQLLQTLLDHQFAHRALLVEAISHASFPNNRAGFSYERLEFLGDSILDVIITPKLFAHARKLKHNELHSVHEALVNAHFLGFCCLNLAAEEEVYAIDKDPSLSLSDGSFLHKTPRVVHLPDFIRLGRQLVPLRSECAERYAQLRDLIHESLLQDSVYPWEILLQLDTPKFFSDVVESILAAIFIDTGGDLAACEGFLNRLGVLRVMNRLVDDHVETMTPKELLGIAATQERVHYTITANTEGPAKRRTYTCAVSIGDVPVATAQHCATKAEAEARAARLAIGIWKARAHDKIGSAAEEREACLGGEEYAGQDEESDEGEDRKEEILKDVVMTDD